MEHKVISFETQGATNSASSAAQNLSSYMQANTDSAMQQYNDEDAEMTEGSASMDLQTEGSAPTDSESYEENSGNSIGNQRIIIKQLGLSSESSYPTAQGRNSINPPTTYVGQEMSEIEDEDDHPDARYEEIGIDRKYFNHDYFLEYHGLAPESKDAEEDSADHMEATTAPAAVEAHENLPSSTAPDNDGTANTVDVTVNTADNTTSKPPRQKTSFHIDETRWLLIYYTKVKLVLETGRHIQMPSDPNAYKLFNDFWEGKILQDEITKESLPPRQARIRGTLHAFTHYPRVKDELHTKAMAVRRDVVNMLEGKTGGQMYVPVVTDEDIKRYGETGVVTLDDPDDPAANPGLAYSEKQLERNANQWQKLYEKETLASEEAAAGPSQEASSEKNDEGGQGPASSGGSSDDAME